MLNNIYRKKGVRSPGKYRSNTFLENLSKGKKLLSGQAKQKKNFLVDSGGNDQLSPHMFNYGGRSGFGGTNAERSGNLFRERQVDSRAMKNFTQEQFMSHNPARKAGLSLSRSKYASPLIPSLNKNLLGDGDLGFQKSSSGRPGFHFKHPSTNRLANFDLKLKKKHLGFGPEDKSGQFLSSRGPKKDTSKRGTLLDRAEFPRGRRARQSEVQG